jgi:gas vesicle protein
MGKTMEEMEYEKEELEQKEGSALSTILRGAELAASAYAAMRYFDRFIDARSILRWMGLSRRRSFWGSAALFGAGALAGAGIAMFVSPMSGKQTRQGVMRGVRRIGEKGRHLVQSAGSQVAQLTESIGIGHGEQGAQQGQQGAQQGQQAAQQGQQGSREQGGREQGGREQGGREQGGMRAGGQQGGEMGGGRNLGGPSGEAHRPG